MCQDREPKTDDSAFPTQPRKREGRRSFDEADVEASKKTRAMDSSAGASRGSLCAPLLVSTGGSCCQPRGVWVAVNSAVFYGSSLSTIGGSTATAGTGTGTGAATSGGSGGASAIPSWDRRAECGYAGLANQGATCYMNSLLQVRDCSHAPVAALRTRHVDVAVVQALFMTPEFRRAMYSWQVVPALLTCLYDAGVSGVRGRRAHACGCAASQYNVEADGDEVDCIPFQMQRLFGLLQLSKKRAISTKVCIPQSGVRGRLWC